MKLASFIMSLKNNQVERKMDIFALYACTHVAEEGKFDLSGYQKIKAWFKRIESQTDYISIK